MQFLKKIKNWFNYRFRYYITFVKIKDFKNRIVARVEVKKRKNFKKIFTITTARKERYEILSLLYDKQYISSKQLKNLKKEIDFLNEENLRFYPFKDATLIRLGDRLHFIQCPFCLKEKVELVLGECDDSILFCHKCKRIFGIDEVNIGKFYKTLYILPTIMV